MDTQTHNGYNAIKFTVVKWAGTVPPKIATLRSRAPNLLNSCQDLGLWLPELCSEDLSHPPVSLLICVTITDVF